MGLWFDFTTHLSGVSRTAYCVHIVRARTLVSNDATKGQ
jgi:hypothetical protein